MSFIGKNIVVGALTAAALITSTNVQAADTSKISGELGLDVSSSYFYRGIHQEDSGLILQPSIGLTFNLMSEGKGLVKSLDLNAGIWNSIHESKTGTAEKHYEADYAFGLTANLGDKFEVSVGYTQLYSPSNAFSTVEEISVSATLICQELCGGKLSAWNPTILASFEVSGTSFGTSEGTYLELSVSPALPFLNDFAGLKGLTATMPIAVGFGLDDYYRTAAQGDESLGFVDAGVDFELPLNNLLPAGYGDWTLTAGVHGLFLGDNLETANRGDNFEVIGTMGLSLAF